MLRTYSTCSCPGQQDTTTYAALVDRVDKGGNFERVDLKVELPEHGHLLHHQGLETGSKGGVVGALLARHLTTQVVKVVKVVQDRMQRSSSALLLLLLLIGAVLQSKASPLPTDFDNDQQLV